MISKDKAYRVVGCCMEVQSGLGPALLENYYLDVLYYELKLSGATARVEAYYYLRLPTINSVNGKPVDKFDSS